ncbi:response regulator [Methylobacterium iners]|jgi:DNA-binding response OmpR family regulator|uniref:Sensor kinase CckA n=1 Tax=Methylobacterium iners TaxID=418707 RepID=A0ABQ4S3C1_9HYPH|nr:response regulator [Methylobacterium iners]GJD96964.1 Sensor kinase CckA [Methylobacterium iners]
MDQPAATARPLALVVEDETVIRMETADLLADAGFEVLEAWNVVTALRQFERRSGIDLLVTDVQMPGGRDGFALAREVAARWPGVAIVVISGVSAPGLRDLPSEARFIPKPFSARVVLETVQEMTRDAGGAPQIA